MIRSTLVALAAVLALAGVACGGEDNSRPSSNELKAALLREANGQITEKQAGCIASALVESGLDDKTLAQAERGESADSIDDEAKAEFDREALEATRACTTPDG